MKAFILKFKKYIIGTGVILFALLSKLVYDWFNNRNIAKVYHERDVLKQEKKLDVANQKIQEIQDKKDAMEKKVSSLEKTVDSISAKEDTVTKESKNNHHTIDALKEWDDVSKNIKFSKRN